MPFINFIFYNVFTNKKELPSKTWINICFIFSILFWPDEQDSNLTHSHELKIHMHDHDHKDQHHQHSHDGDLKQETHGHEHKHEEVSHKHRFVIDLHHQEWPKG